MALGFGGSYNYPKRTVHVSLEWFGPVDPYNVLDPEEFIGQSSGDQKSNKFGRLEDVIGLDDLLNEESESAAHFNRLKFIIGFGVRT